LLAQIDDMATENLQKPAIQTGKLTQYPAISWLAVAPENSSSQIAISATPNRSHCATFQPKNTAS